MIIKLFLCKDFDSYKTSDKFNIIKKKVSLIGSGSVIVLIDPNVKYKKKLRKVRALNFE